MLAIVRPRAIHARTIETVHFRHPHFRGPINFRSKTGDRSA
jgi:hypothetical protein